MGIPYVRPPTGELRFRRPEPADPWTGTYEANRHVECIQVDNWDQIQKSCCAKFLCLNFFNIYYIYLRNTINILLQNVNIIPAE